MKKYVFEPKRLPVISGYEAVRILNKLRSGQLINVNLSLGKYKNVPVEVLGKRVIFEWVGNENEQLSLELDVHQLMLIAKKDYRVYVIYSNNSTEHLGYFKGNNYYQLIAIDPHKAPTIEINGIRMHKTKGTDPFSNAKLKILKLKVKKGMRVLDICTGLGYTAIWAAIFGGQVTSIERDINVLEMAEFNPWSEELSNIEILIGDALEVIKQLDNDYYDRVINDPPRFSVAGELYSLAFFEEIFRVLKPGGIFFQYTGFPQERYRGKSIVKGIGERLRKIGFITKFDARAEGFICRKPRLYR